MGPGQDLPRAAGDCCLPCLENYAVCRLQQEFSVMATHGSHHRERLLHLGLLCPDKANENLRWGLCRSLPGHSVQPGLEGLRVVIVRSSHGGVTQFGLNPGSPPYQLSGIWQEDSGLSVLNCIMKIKMPIPQGCHNNPVGYVCKSLRTCPASGKWK